MSVNKSRPHVLVLPEDDANRQLANGFQLMGTTRQYQVLAPAGGWLEVLAQFNSDHVRSMEAVKERFIILLIDFDGRANRFEEARHAIPEHLRERVFILGAWTEPEDLKPDFGSYETIGSKLAKDCRDGTDETWQHRQLAHNTSEVERLRKHVRPFLF